MKKLIAMILALAALFSLTACSSPEKEDTEKEPITWTRPTKETDAEPTEFPGFDTEDSQEDTIDEEFTEETTEPGPSEEELQLLLEYQELSNRYYSLGYAYDTITTAQAQISQDYQRIQELDVVDKWFGTEYLSPEYYDGFSSETNWNRQEILDHYVVISDKRLTQTSEYVDHLGNRTSANYPLSWKYDTEGSEFSAPTYNAFSMYALNPEGLSNFHHFYEYDQQGRVSKIIYSNAEQFNEQPTAVYIATPTYDENGNMVKKTFMDNYNSFDVLYTYDEENRLTQIRKDGVNGRRTEWYYQYDDQGNLIRSEEAQLLYKEEWDMDLYESRDIMEYTYNTKNILTSGKRTQECWNTNTTSHMEGFHLVIDFVNQYISSYAEDTYVFQCDDQGRVTFFQITHGYEKFFCSDSSFWKEEKPTNATTETTITYGDYYIAVPKNNY